MPRVIKRKEHPLSMRLPETDIAIIDRAASLRGRSRTDFVREAVEAFRAQWKAELAAGSVPRPEEDKPAARKRRRSASRSRSASRTAAKKATATSASSSTLDDLLARSRGADWARRILRSYTID